ncbi:conserved Plasmodium protein, unknown function [Plasmodium gaboni]|uniref:Cell cycle associated protein n=1 Tax=Plasmodium gaboni TaxID=647221 RepID=A0ABY1UL17_9APIC|nr:conserved Plasmodium protein, unknown function [Plasmodium gaboni]
MTDINDIIKEIIYRSADECNFNNEELNFTSILKFFYDITNKYNVKKQLCDEIFNKLLIICKNIIDDNSITDHDNNIINRNNNIIDNNIDKFNYYYNTNDEYMQTNIRHSDEYQIRDIKNCHNNNIIREHNSYYKNSEYVNPLIILKNDEHKNNINNKNSTCSTIVKIKPLYNEKAKEEKLDVYYYDINKDKKLNNLYSSYLYKNQQKDQKGIIYNDNNNNNNRSHNNIIISYNNQTIPIHKEKYPCVYFIEDDNIKNNDDDNNIIHIDEKSFLHKNNRNLLKLFLNGDIIHNVYNKIIKNKHLKKTNRNSLQDKNSKMKLYNESNIFFTFCILRKYYYTWFQHSYKQKILQKRLEKYNKIVRKKILLKYYDLWFYYNEKKNYLKSAYDKFVNKKNIKLLKQFFNNFINKYKKRKKKNFIYLVHIFNEWKNYTKKRKTLQYATKKITQKKKKKFFLLWKNNFLNKKMKKKKKNEIQNIYNKNLVIKCYVHFILFYNKRKKEHINYSVIYNNTKYNLSYKYFSLFIQIYRENIFFKQYYTLYLEKVRNIFFKKYFTILKEYVSKRKKLQTSFLNINRNKQINFLKFYMEKWIHRYNEKAKFNNILQIYHDKNKLYIFKKYFDIIKKHKEKSFNLKKKFLFLYEKKNKEQVQHIFTNWKNYYSINSTKYILLYNKYKYKLLINYFHFLYNYKNYRKTKKKKTKQMDDYSKNKLKTKAFMKWIFYHKNYKINILTFYNFKNDGNFFVYFILKMLWKYQTIDNKTHSKTFFDLINFSNINININTLIYIHKKYFTKKNIQINVNIFYENVMFVYKTLNIVFSYIPVLFFVNMNKLKFNLPYISFAIKMALYKRIFDTWLVDCRRIKQFKKLVNNKLLKNYFMRFFSLIQKKKKLNNELIKYKYKRKIILKKKLFSTWVFLWNKYINFRSNFEKFDVNNKRKRIKKIWLKWLAITKENKLKKEQIVEFFKSLLKKKKKKVWDTLNEYVSTCRRKKIQNKIADLYCMKNYKKKAFMSLFMYSKNVMYFKTLNNIAQSYLKRLCIIKWRNITREFFKRKKELQNRQYHFDLNIQRKYFRILLLFVHFRAIKKKKFLHFKEIQYKIWIYRYFNEWKNYIKIKQNKKEFLENMKNLFNRKKKLQFLSKWYTSFIINVKFKEVEKIIAFKFSILTFETLFLYNQKMKRIELFLRNRSKVFICQNIIKRWKHYIKIKRLKKHIRLKNFHLIKDKYFSTWKKTLDKVRKRKIRESKIYKYRQTKDKNIIHLFYNEWKNVFLQNKNIKHFVYVINNHLLYKLKYRSFVVIYKNCEYYSTLQFLFNNFLIDKRTKIKRNVFSILKCNTKNRRTHKKAIRFFYNNIMSKYFNAIKIYRQRRLTYRKNEQELINKRKATYFYAIMNFYNFLNKVKSNFYQIRIRVDNKIKKEFFSNWFLFVMKRKKERNTFLSVLRKRVNKVKSEIFFNMKRRVNKKKYVLLLLNRMEELIKNKIYRYGINQLKINRKCSKIHEKLYLKMQKKMNQKILQKCFKTLKNRISKKRKRELEKNMVSFFCEQLFKKKYFNIICHVSKIKMMERNMNILKIGNNHLFYLLRRHFDIWKYYIDKKKEYKKKIELININKKAKIFYFMLYLKIKSNYDNICVLYKMYSLFHSSSCKMINLDEALKYRSKLKCCNIDIDRNYILGYYENQNKDLEDRVYEYMDVPLSNKKKNMLHKFLYLKKKVVMLSKIYNEIKFEQDDLLYLNKIKYKEKKKKKLQGIQNHIHICYMLKNSNMSSLLLNYLLMYDYYDMYYFCLHIKKHFNILYNYFFNFLSVKMKKLLLKFFKKSISLSNFIKMISIKDKDIHQHFKILIFIYYLFSRYIRYDHKSDECDNNTMYGNNKLVSDINNNNNNNNICVIITKVINNFLYIKDSYVDEEESVSDLHNNNLNIKKNKLKGSNKLNKKYISKKEKKKKSIYVDKKIKRENKNMLRKSCNNKYVVYLNSDKKNKNDNKKKNVHEYMNCKLNKMSNMNLFMSQVSCISSVGSSNNSEEYIIRRKEEINEKEKDIRNISINNIYNNKNNYNYNCSGINKMCILSGYKNIQENLLKNRIEENMKEYIRQFYEDLKIYILSNFRDTDNSSINIKINYSFLLLNVEKKKIIEMYIFFKKFKKSVISWKMYCKYKKERREIDINKMNNIKNKMTKEIVEKYFGIWIILFNEKVKEIKKKRKIFLKKHIHLIFISWHKLIQVNNYDKEKFKELKQVCFNRIKKIYFEKLYLYYIKMKNEKRNYAIIKKHCNNKKKQTFFYVWLLLYQYEKKYYYINKQMNNKKLQEYFYKWIYIYEKKQIYIHFCNTLNELFFKKYIFVPIIKQFKFYNYIKEKKENIEKKYFLIYYNIIKKNNILNKLQLYIYTSIQYKELKYLFSVWNKKYKKRKICRDELQQIIINKKRKYLDDWLAKYNESKNNVIKKYMHMNNFKRMLYWNKWMSYHRYMKIIKKNNKYLLLKYFSIYKRKYNTNVVIQNFIKNKNNKLIKDIFTVLKEYKDVKKYHKHIEEYCKTYYKKKTLKMYYSYWLYEYYKIKKIKNVLHYMFKIYNDKMKRVIMNKWITYINKKRFLRNNHNNIVKSKNNIIINKCFLMWNKLYNFLKKKKRNILYTYIHIWSIHYKFVCFIKKINIYLYNIYQNNIFSFYYILKKKNENYYCLQEKGKFVFIQNQICEYLKYKNDMLYDTFHSLYIYKEKNKTLRKYLELYKMKNIQKEKRKIFFILLKYKNIKKKKNMLLSTLYTDIINQKKEYLLKKYFIILTNIYFYNYHLNVCEKTINDRREKRIINCFLNKWKEYIKECKQLNYLDMLSQQFLNYRRKSEFIISLKQYYVEHKWKNYCEYNSLIFYKKVQERMLSNFIKFWIMKANQFEYFQQKFDEFQKQYNKNIIKKYFFLLIFSINKIKIEKKNFDIVHLKRIKMMKYKVFYYLYDMTMSSIKKYEQVMTTLKHQKGNEICLKRKFYFAFLNYIKYKKSIHQILITLQDKKNVSLLRKYFYIFIYKYVTNMNHYKYYYYNKFLSLWKYYIVMRKGHKSSQKSDESESVDGQVGGAEYYDEEGDEEDEEDEEDDEDDEDEEDDEGDEDDEVDEDDEDDEEDEDEDVEKEDLNDEKEDNHDEKEDAYNDKNYNNVDNNDDNNKEENSSYEKFSSENHINNKDHVDFFVDILDDEIKVQKETKPFDNSSTSNDSLGYSSCIFKIEKKNSNQNNKKEKIVENNNTRDYINSGKDNLKESFETKDDSDTSCSIDINNLVMIK